MVNQLSKTKILELFQRLNEELSFDSTIGELYLVGGAVMCLVFNARASTKDVDAYFLPTRKMRKAAVKVGEETGIGDKWLNDAVKGFLSNKGEFNTYLELSHLRVFVAQADYLLAMKCLAMRIGEEFQDENDIRYLLRYLNIENYEDAIKAIIRFYPIERFPQKTLYALEEILA